METNHGSEVTKLLQAGLPKGHDGLPWDSDKVCECDVADKLGERGRLVPNVGPWDPSFPDHPEHKGTSKQPRNGYDPKKLNCRDITIAGACADVCGCMQSRMLALWQCCIEYDESPELIRRPGSHGDGNSNSAVVWALKGCIDAKRPPVPNDARLEPGQWRHVPPCISKIAPDANPLFPIVD